MTVAKAAVPVAGAAANIVIEPAQADDLPAIVALFADDPIGGHGDSAEPAAQADYRAAFAEIAAAPNSNLFVARRDGRVVGTFQLTYTRLISGRGTLHAVLNGLQVAACGRSLGIGAAMVAAAERQARARGAGVLELTSNLKRTDAHRFYERLGFAKSHAGFKKQL